MECFIYDQYQIMLTPSPHHPLLPNENDNVHVFIFQKNQKDLLWKRTRKSLITVGKISLLVIRLIVLSIPMLVSALALNQLPDYQVLVSQTNDMGQGANGVVRSLAVHV